MPDEDDEEDARGGYVFTADPDAAPVVSRCGNRQDLS